MTLTPWQVKKGVVLSEHVGYMDVGLNAGLPAQAPVVVVGFPRRRRVLLLLWAPRAGAVCCCCCGLPAQFPSATTTAAATTTAFPAQFLSAEAAEIAGADLRMHSDGPKRMAAAGW